MNRLKRYIKIGVVLVLLLIMFVACGGTSTMPKRKKSRCNTCPKFSYLDTYYNLSDNEFQVYS